MPGLAPERVDIFPAGLAALSAVLETLDIARVEFVDASLQHGLLYDLAARRAEENVQERTVEGWRRRFNVDRDQANRVRRLALELHAAVAEQWDLGDADCRRLLGWAADLHEIGLMVSSRQPNRHGAYLVENGDFPGFTSEQRRAVALLIRSHRGGFPNFAFAAFSEPMAGRLKRLAVLLRLAVICERTRTDADSPTVAIAVRDDTIDVVDRRRLARRSCVVAGRTRMGARTSRDRRSGADAQYASLDERVSGRRGPAAMRFAK